MMLPNAISLKAGTGEVSLETTLPKWEGEAYAIHFESVEQTVQVLVDGESRYLYGADPEAEDFVYRSAHNINQVELKQEDSGKKLTIIYRSSPLFIIEMGALREVCFGTKSDLMLCRFRESVPYIFISFFAVFINMSALLLLTAYRGMPVTGNLCVTLLAVLAVVFFNSENPALWPALHYQPALSSFLDWSFYYLDPLIQLMAWLSMYYAGWNFRSGERWKRNCGLGFGLVYIGAVSASLMGFYNFNLTRPFFMVFGFAYTICLLWDNKKYREKGDSLGLSRAVLVLLAGYYLDYLRYCLMLLPWLNQWLVPFRVKVPFQFFIGLTLMISGCLVLRETIWQMAKREADIEVESATAWMQAKYARQQYESIVQRDDSLRSLSHDMRFHFRAAAALLAEKKIQEAERYLTEIEERVAAIRLAPWCEDNVANLTIGWYADQLQQQKIPFSVSANIPIMKEEVHADLNCILSNALQNAMEGCRGQEDPFVRLSAKPKPKGNELLIRIENRCSKSLVGRQQRFPTTKTGDNHGIGMASMEAAAKRQHGYLNISADEGVFRLDVVLSKVFL